MTGRARVTIYVRPGCHLCEEAERAIRHAACAEAFDLEIINIERDEELIRRYGEQIPVVFINGIKAFIYRVDPDAFCRRLRRLSERASRT